ncbi:6229_t:CDS:1, partial [Paraglomus brasilianum]
MTNNPRINTLTFLSTITTSSNEPLYTVSSSRRRYKVGVRHVQTRYTHYYDLSTMEIYYFNTPFYYYDFEQQAYMVYYIPSGQGVEATTAVEDIKSSSNNDFAHICIRYSKSTFYYYDFEQQAYIPSGQGVEATTAVEDI